MRKWLFLATVLVSFNSWSTVTTGVENCPTHFEGRVKEIIESQDSDDFFSSNKVIFSNERSLKGEFKKNVIVDVLKNGPFTVEREKDYRVQLRNGKICWIEEI